MLFFCKALEGNSSRDNKSKRGTGNWKLNVGSMKRGLENWNLNVNSMKRSRNVNANAKK